MAPRYAWIANVFTLLACATLGILPGPVAAADGGPRVPALLRRAAERLGWQGFRCDPVSPQTGLTCVGTLKGYPREVAIIVPPAFHAKAQADLILHLHGFNLDNHPLAYMLQYFRYAEMLAKSGRDALMVVPLSYGRCDDFNESLADAPAHFKAFVEEALAEAQGAGLVEQPEPRMITLTGHSGAYYPLSSIIQNGVYTDQVKELFLLDATYGGAEQFEVFAADPRHRFWSAYHDYDANMHVVNPEIMSYLHGHGIPYYVSPVADVPSAQVHGNRVGFVVSDVDHDSTSVKYLLDFLHT